MTTVSSSAAATSGARSHAWPSTPDTTSWCPTPRGPGTLADLVASLGSRARAATAPEAAEAGDLVVLAIPLGRVDQLAAAPLAGKVVIDTCNY